MFPGEKKVARFTKNDDGTNREKKWGRLMNSVFHQEFHLKWRVS